MALKFTPPSWDRPNQHEYIGKAAGSLESIFNAYQQSKMRGQQMGIGMAGQGIDPVAGGSDPGSLYGQLIERHKAGRSQQSKESAASVRKDEAQAGLYDAQVQALGNDQVYIDPDSGRQIVVPRGSKLIPRMSKANVSANPDLDSALELYETAKQGLVAGLEGSQTGPIMGRLPAFTAGQQIAKGSIAAMAPVLKQLFRTAGEGVFTDRDQQMLLDMIPDRTVVPEARDTIITNIDNIVKAKLKIRSRAASAPRGQSPAVAPAQGSAQGQEVRRQARVNGQLKDAIYTSQGKFLRYE